MNPLAPDISDADLLSYLRPVYPNGIFPLALGWWILIGMMLSLVFAAFLYRNRPQARRRRQAFAVLDGLEAAFKEQEDVSALSSGLSVLLRRVAVARFGREKAAALNGRAWTSFLEETGAVLEEEDRMLLEQQAYAPGCRDKETPGRGERVIAAVRGWMEHNL